MRQVDTELLHWRPGRRASQDLIADILPPPEYIIESYLVSLQAMSASPAERKPLIDYLKTLKNDYDTRHDFWANETLDGEMKDQLLDKAGRPAREFYQVAFSQLVPALEKDGSAAAGAALDIVTAHYVTHRVAINKLVQLATKGTKSTSKMPRRKSRRRPGSCWPYCSSSLRLCALSGWDFAQRVAAFELRH